MLLDPSHTHTHRPTCSVECAHAYSFLLCLSFSFVPLSFVDVYWFMLCLPTIGTRAADQTRLYSCPILSCFLCVYVFFCVLAGFSHSTCVPRSSLIDGFDARHLCE